MKTKIIYFLFVLLPVCFVPSLFGNNIQVSSAALTGQNTTGNYTLVQFNLSWDNSWRDAVNWDAAWVFVKFRRSQDTTWRHAALSTTQAAHNIPGGFTGFPASDGTGIFIYRSSTGNGTVNLSNIQARWVYGTQGVQDADLVEVKVFAIEMVYIPEGSFYAGDGTTNNVTAQLSQGTTTSPYLISGEGSITLGGAPLTNLGNRNATGISPPDDFNNITTQTLPAAFPKGFDDIYCMKYQISQGQYTDFLNTLTRTQQKTRVLTNISGDAFTNIFVMTGTSTVFLRNRITCPASGNGTVQPVVFSCDRIDRACNFISYMDQAAFYDWAALRPMSELELEKAARGPLQPVAGEYAWGNTTVVFGINFSGTENGTETMTNAGANCNAGSVSFIGGDGSTVGPLRCGIFATATSTRVTSGASYYGVLELSGTVSEIVVTVGQVLGRVFTALHGDGTLTMLGNGNTLNWPGLFGGEINQATGMGRKMGDFGSSIVTDLRISDRLGINSSPNSRSSLNGGRGGRTAPAGTVLNPFNNNKQ